MGDTSRSVEMPLQFCWISSTVLIVILGLHLRDNFMATGFLHLSWKRCFDTQTWADWKPGSNRRWAMVEDLQEQHLRPRLSRRVVRELLRNGFSGNNSPSFSYPVGDDGKGTAVLVSDFDKTGRLLRSDLHSN